ncbi:MAG: 6-pyruvoyl trahydropterin synthase family protein [Candidatus Woesearchaeota archaeon]
MNHNYEICRRLRFEAGHRIHSTGYTGPCSSIHGHSYVLYAYARPLYNTLNKHGMVIDFGDVKKILGTWIDDQIDHAFIVSKWDPLLKFLEENNQKHYILSDVPTAENIAKEILEISGALFQERDIEIFKVELWETENCYATVYK